MIPEFPDRLEESAPRQGFLEHEDIFSPSVIAYQRTRATSSNLPTILDGGEGRSTPCPGGWSTYLPMCSGWTQRSRRRRKAACCQFRHRSGRCLIAGSSSGASTVNWSSTWMGSPWAIGAKRGRGACTASGLFRVVKVDQKRERKVPTLVLHDCRRTAVPEPRAGGIPDKVAMIFTGHQTGSVYRPLQHRQRARPPRCWRQAGGDRRHARHPRSGRADGDCLA